MENFLALTAITHRLTPEYAEKFQAFLIGIIAANIRTEDWEDALAKAAVCMKDICGITVQIPIAEVQ